jgi:hypothetical protein
MFIVAETFFRKTLHTKTKRVFQNSTHFPASLIVLEKLKNTLCAHRPQQKHKKVLTDGCIH